MNRYVLYVRKSDEDRANQVRSISDQKTEMLEVAVREGITITHVIEDERSAKTAHKRPGFDKMIKLLEKGTVNAILVWSANRLARNMTEGGLLQDMLSAGTIQEIRTPRQVVRPGDNILPFILELAQATQYSLTLAVDVRRTMRLKALEGQLPQRAPEGYVNTTAVISDKVVNVIGTDPDRFPLIRMAWELLLTGNHSLATIRDTLNNKWGYTTRKSWGKRPVKYKRLGGRPISKSILHRIFTNPFYAGYFYHKSAGDVLIKGTHEPMITMQDFQAAQEILHRSGHQHPIRRDFPYTGLITCGRCGCRITAEQKKGRHGRGEYVYYRCTNGRNQCNYKGVRQEVLEKQLEDHLCGIAFDTDALAIAHQAIEIVYTEESSKYEATCRKQREARQETERRLKKLVELRLDEGIDQTLFDQMRTDLQDKLNSLKVIEEEKPTSPDKIREELREIASICHQAPIEFSTGTPARRRALAQRIATSYVLTGQELSVEYHPLVAPLANAKLQPKIGGLETVEISSRKSKRTLVKPSVPIGWGKGMLLETFQIIWGLIAEPITRED